jgi:hypothetical protein
MHGTTSTKSWGSFFARLSSSDRETALQAWYSTFNDRWQRDKLRKAIEDVVSWPNPTAKADVVWLLDRADDLAEDRNNAIHAPCCLYVDGGTVMGAAFFSGNSRAKNLNGKKLIAEFEWCERYTEVLSVFVQKLETGFAFADKYPWPERLTLPARM